MKSLFAVLTPLFTCAVLTLAASPAQAQSAVGFSWWSNPVLVKEINLTPEQTGKIRQIVRSYRDRLFDARNGVQKAEAQLEDMMNDDVVDQNATKPVIDRLAAGRSNLTHLVTEMSIQVRAVLTADQWHQLVRLWRDSQKKKLADTQVAQ
jgi:Spy/CpxP family protein refolding chaperone